MREAVRDSLRRAITASAVLTRNRVREKLSGELIQDRGGPLLDSIRFEIVEDARGMAATVWNTVSYARYLEYGTAPHEIRARSARALAFSLGRGVGLPPRRSIIPATAPIPSWAATLIEMAPAIQSRVEAGRARAIGEGG